MTLAQLIEKVRQWDLSATPNAPKAESKYQTILAQLEYHAKHEWRTYLPAEYSDDDPSYMERLAAWVGSERTEAGQKLLLEYALHISFFSWDDFRALYRTAFEREVIPWVAGQLGTTLTAQGIDGFSRDVTRAVHDSTWYCPITDSLDINEFYKVNHLVGTGHRPTFYTLQMLAEKYEQDPAIARNLNAYMTGSRVQRLVLLEDIVGSSQQCLESIRWAVAKLNCPVLFVPLILCPNGVVALRDEEARSHGRLAVRPVIELQRRDLVGPERKGVDGWPIAANLEKFMKKWKAAHAPALNEFGYKSTGCSIVTFANTPNNTPPLVHRACPRWRCLFPRVARAS